MVRSASRRQVYVACVNLATMRVSNHEATGEELTKNRYSSSNSSSSLTFAVLCRACGLLIEPVVNGSRDPDA
jgi:hypothetical protein